MPEPFKFSTPMPSSRPAKENGKFGPMGKYPMKGQIYANNIVGITITVTIIITIIIGKPKCDLQEAADSLTNDICDLVSGLAVIFNQFCVHRVGGT